MTTHPTTAKTPVLFIAGHGRSGSTLLDRVLGQIPGCFSGGELRHIWHRGYLGEQLCGCSEPFGKCTFWREVTDRAFGPTGPDVEETLRLKRHVDRWWRSPELALPRRRKSLQADLDAYNGSISALYGAIREISGARMIVDSSKDVSHGFVLAANPTIDVHVVHLVRDSRASAYSWRRHKYDPGKQRELDRYSLLKTSAAWSASHTLASLFRFVAPSYQVVRYSDFASRPAETIEAIAASIGVPDGSPVDDDGSVDLAVGHTVAGNPVRFHNGRIEIRPDEEWREKLDPVGKTVVTTLTGPVLLAVRGRAAK